MTDLKCPECGCPVSPDATRCPNCSYKYDQELAKVPPRAMARALRSRVLAMRPGVKYAGRFISGPALLRHLLRVHFADRW